MLLLLDVSCKPHKKHIQYTQKEMKIDQISHYKNQLYMQRNSKRDEGQKNCKRENNKMVRVSPFL